MPKTPLLLGYDAAGEATLGPLLDPNPNWGHCLVDAGRGDPLPTDSQLREVLAQASVLVTIFSTSPDGKEFELKACALAQELGVPIMLVGDTDQCFKREPHLGKLSQVAAAVTVVAAAEVSAAGEIYPKAVITHIFPPVWATYFVPLTAEERAKARSYMEVKKNDQVVFISGTKNHAANLEVISATVRAVGNPKDGLYRVVFAQHPGDKGEGEDTTAARQQIYRDAMAPMNVFGQHLVVASPPKDSGLSGDMLVKAADLVLVVSKASAARTAVAQRLPLIFVRTPEALKAYTREFGEGPNDFVTAMAASQAEDDSSLANEIVNLICGGSGGRVAKQRAFLPEPPAGSTSVSMLEAAILAVVRSD